MSTLRVPLAGWLWLLMVAALLAIGLVRHINLLTLMACLLLIVWCLNVLLAYFHSRRLRGRRRIDGPVFAQSPFEMHVEVANPRRTASRSVRVEDRGPAHALAWFTPYMAGRHIETIRARIMLPDRGRYVLGPLWASSAYPFGLARRGTRLAEGEELVVLPRLGRLHRGKLRQFLSRGATAAEPIRRATRRWTESQAEFHGLRAFRAGDSPRWIHWRTTARRGELMVREFEDAPGEHFILVLDPYSPPEERVEQRATESENAARSRNDPSSPLPRLSVWPSLEAAISFAATVCWEWRLHQGNRFVLGVAGAAPIVLDGTASRDHALRLLESLAVQEPHQNEDDVSIVNALSRVVLPPAPVLLISARANRLEATLARELNRPIVSVEASVLRDLDFYESPDSCEVVAPQRIPIHG
jgi:uncharacterized protein (DUF58 family)